MPIFTNFCVLPKTQATFGKLFDSAALLFLSLLTPLSFASDNAEIERAVDALLSKMTLAEKVGQMNLYNGFWDATGPAPDSGNDQIKYEHLRKGWVGALLNVRGRDRVLALQKVAVEQTRLGIPLMFGLDVLHGYQTLFPIPLAEASSWDLEAIERSARIAAVEATAHGINWTFAPMVDVSEDPRWGRVAEGAGEDPYLGAEIARARVRGFQGQDLAASDTLAACAKHLAGYGFAEAGRDYNRVDVSRYTLYNTILPPFRAAVDAGARTLMNAFNSLNGTPATASEFLQRDLLKRQWGFTGFVVSDWTSIQELIQHGVASNRTDAAALAVNAGSDMDMESAIYINELAALVERGEIDEAQIDDAVRRVLRVKFELGLFDDPYRYTKRPAEPPPQEHAAAARDMARKSMVLLKNSNNLLPLDKNRSGIAVIGPLAADQSSPLGTARAAAIDGSAVSLLEGLKQHGVTYTYERGVDFNIGVSAFSDPLVFELEDRSAIEQARALAKRSEVVVLMLGEHGYQSGEGRSRTQLDLPGLQQELLEAVYSVNQNIVLLLASGRPLNLTWADAHIPAIVQTWHLGSQSGHAIADLLFGAFNPSGKLPMSFPRSVGQIPLSYRAVSTGRPDPLTTVFWSHYSDQANDPLYPFGHGLSYTTFGYSQLSLTAVPPSSIRVKVTVTNTGNRAGAEVIQVYVRDKVSRLVRPVKELKAFTKRFLTPGEKAELTFELTREALGFYDAEGAFIFEPGEFEIMVGGSSAIALTKSIEL